MEQKKDLKQILIQNNQKGNYQDDILDDMEKNLYQTEDIGNDITNELHGQRQKLVKANDTAKDTNHLLKKGERQAKSIYYSNIKIKALLCFVIFLNTVAIIALLIYKLEKK